jgi:hypothetical protein
VPGAVSSALLRCAALAEFAPSCHKRLTRAAGASQCLLCSTKGVSVEQTFPKLLAFRCLLWKCGKLSRSPPSRKESNGEVL